MIFKTQQKKQDVAGCGILCSEIQVQIAALRGGELLETETLQEETLLETETLLEETLPE